MDNHLGRVHQFDEQSRNFNVARKLTAVADKPLRSYSWRNRGHFDQNPYGGICVLASETHEYMARPREHVFPGVQKILDLFHEAQKIDEWPGENYDGTSVLAGAKVCQQAGWISSYDWAFDLHTLLLHLSYRGGVIMGTDWDNNMMQPTPEGELKRGGGVAGGHAYRLSSIDVPNKRVWVDQTWSQKWGINGRAWMSWDTLDSLRTDGGECMIPAVR